MVQFNPSGTGVALVTPFKNHVIDFESFSRLIDHVITGGVEYVIPLGTTGEASSLSDEEQEAVIRHTIKVVDGRVPVVAGHFGGNNTAQLCERLRAFDATGISAVLSSSPAYVKPSQEGIYQHYMALADASPRPIIIYNVPSRTASNISAKTLVRLAHASEKFVAVKDASADLVQGAEIARDAPTRFALLSGDDPTALAQTSVGGVGVISVIANVFPKAFSSMMRHALAGEYEAGLRIHNQLLDIHPWLYIEGNPVGIKQALEIAGICSSELRLPLVKMSEQNKQRLMEEMQKLGI